MCLSNVLFNSLLLDADILVEDVAALHGLDSAILMQISLLQTTPLSFAEVDLS